MAEKKSRKRDRRRKGGKYPGNAELGVLGVAATGEASPRQDYGEGALGRPLEGTITQSDAVREGSTGASFGEASTGGGTVRPGSSGGGPTGLGAQGSSYDVGVRGPGTVGGARARLEHWQGPLPGLRARWRQGAASREIPREEYEPAFSLGWEMASEPRHRGRDWEEVVADFRREWARRHPDIPWERVAPAARDGFEESPETAEVRGEAEHRRAE
ncbi:MAG TPA: hypothetical protein VHS06_10100 [Chloroflexota bacterium]|nr:hypothetical protein [Chloroflexota bacterium]